MRERIVIAAGECFDRFGVGKATMEDVAAQANLSRPTLYRYFGNREDLLIAVFERAVKEFNARLRQRLRREASLTDSVITAVSLSIEVGLEDPYVRAAFRPESLGLSSAAFSTHFKDLVAQRWSAMLYRAIDRGEARADLVVPEACRWLMDVEFVLGIRVMEGTLAMSDVARVLHQFVLPALRPQADVDSGVPTDSDNRLNHTELSPT